MAAPTERPKIRACLFDMDGLLINTEQVYTEVTNTILERHGKGRLPWEIKATLQGLPGPSASAKFLEWSQLPYTPDELFAETSKLQKTRWSGVAPMPGALELLQALGTPAGPVPFALATSSHSANYELKTAHLGHMFDLFGDAKVLGDDRRIAPGRGKPAPDIWLLALAVLNAQRRAGGATDDILPAECLVFEDGIPGVEGARAAGCQVVWVPDPNIRALFRDSEADIVGPWGEVLDSLEQLDYAKYGL
ncbi:HAD-like domain-containing protein [Dipodascopsis tothii]|uniref:HAD-like domain-containing protein n=1 Tax=Dipodascopsis tothii TaxID=44089 RepID=UPI0034CFBE0E